VTLTAGGQLMVGLRDGRILVLPLSSAGATPMLDVAIASVRRMG